MWKTSETIIEIAGKQWSTATLMVGSYLTQHMVNRIFPIPDYRNSAQLPLWPTNLLPFISVASMGEQNTHFTMISDGISHSLFMADWQSYYASIFYSCFNRWTNYPINNDLKFQPFFRQIDNHTILIQAFRTRWLIFYFGNKVPLNQNTEHSHLFKNIITHHNFNQLPSN